MLSEDPDYRALQEMQIEAAPKQLLVITAITLVVLVAAITCMYGGYLLMHVPDNHWVVGSVCIFTGLGLIALDIIGFTYAIATNPGLKASLQVSEDTY